MSSTVSNKYKHDCERCKFVGHISGYDVYESCDGSEYRWILRGSSEGSDYVTTNNIDRYFKLRP